LVGFQNEKSDVMRRVGPSKRHHDWWGIRKTVFWSDLRLRRQTPRFPRLGSESHRTSRKSNKRNIKNYTAGTMPVSANDRKKTERGGRRVGGQTEIMTGQPEQVKNAKRGGGRAFRANGRQRRKERRG